MHRSPFNRFRKISNKFQVIFGGLILIALTLLGVIMFMFLSKELSAWGRRQLGISTNLIAQETNFLMQQSIEQYLMDHARHARDMAAFLHGQAQAGAMTEETARSIFKKFVLDSGMSRIGETGYLAGIDGKGVAVIHPNAEGKDYSSYDFMKQAISTKNGFIEYMIKGAGDTEEREKVGGMAYFAPWDLIVWASSYKSEFSSLFDISSMTTMLDSVAAEFGVEILIVTREGKSIMNPYNARSPVLDALDVDGTPWIRRMVETGKGTTRFNPVGDNGIALGQKISCFTPLEITGWIIAVSVPASEINELAYSSLLIIVTVSIVLFLLLFLLISLVTRGLTRPLERTRKLLAETLGGNLAQRITIDSGDEVGQMGQHFNQLLDMLEDMMKHVKSNSSEITDMVQTLSASTQEISATANEQAAAVKEIVSTIEDTNHLAKNISTRVEEVSRIANDTKKNVSDGVLAVRDNISKMNEIHDSNGKTITSINYLSDKIKNIWDIVNMINNIADQTKIIAFNAELEASSAGEAGKNFQIVASEIRRLADGTVNATNEIKNRIQEIERSSDALLLSSEQGTERIVQGKELSQHMNQLFGNIAMSAEVSDSSTQQIALSIRQQVSSYDQIIIAIRQISQGIDNFVVSTKATSGTTDNLRKMAGLLTGLLGKFEKPGV